MPSRAYRDCHGPRGFGVPREAWPRVFSWQCRSLTLSHFFSSSLRSTLSKVPGSARGAGKVENSLSWGVPLGLRHGYFSWPMCQAWPPAMNVLRGTFRHVRTWQAQKEFAAVDNLGMLQAVSGLRTRDRPISLQSGVWRSLKPSGWFFLCPTSALKMRHCNKGSRNESYSRPDQKLIGKINLARATMSCT